MGASTHLSLLGVGLILGEIIVGKGTIKLPFFACCGLSLHCTTMITLKIGCWTCCGVGFWDWLQPMILGLMVWLFCTLLTRIFKARKLWSWEGFSQFYLSNWCLPCVNDILENPFRDHSSGCIFSKSFPGPVLRKWIGHYRQRWNCIQSLFSAMF